MYNCAVDSVWALGKAAASIGAWVILISTDYVFDGNSAPYSVDAHPHPLNGYGVSKACGEAAIQAALPSAAILRVPVLFGEFSPAQRCIFDRKRRDSLGKTKNLNESAVTVLASAVLSEKECKIDDYCIRYPTYCGDVAVVLRQMIDRYISLG